jgi:uncharacterized protein
MPLTAKGEKILAAMIEEYGEEEGKKIFYASKNAGTISGVDAMQMNDSLQLEFDDKAFERDTAGKLKFMHGGYLRTMPKIARTGIQIYKGIECGNADMEKVRVFRPVDSVFSKSAVNSYAGLPITVDHPGGMVDASNWKQHAVGETGDDILREGETVRVPMMLRDAEAIKTVMSGKNQISVGYSCDLEWVDGITEDGQKYDAVQRNIRGNHVAIVSTARGGPELKFGDKGDDAMELKTITVDGISCQMTDTAVALVQKLQDSFEEFKKKKKKGEEESEEEVDGLKKDVAAKDAAIAVKDKDITDLQAKLKDALDPKRTRDAAVKLLSVIEKASKITGKPIKIDSVIDTATLLREVVTAKLGDMVKDWDDNKIEAGFDAISFAAPASTLTDAVRIFSRPGNNGGHPSGSNDPRDQAYYDSVKDLENAWQKKPA